MGKIFLTSDTHFCHDKDFCYKPRGFSNVKEMNEAIVDKWNSVVSSDDIVYHLGDLYLNDSVEAIKYIKQLNGRIIWIRGNHDTTNKIDYVYNHCSNVELMAGLNSSFAMILPYKKLRCYLSHYPTLVANYDEKHFSQHTINFHGHTHQTEKFLFPDNPFIYNVGLDCQDNYPIEIEEALEDVRQAYFNVKPYSRIFI